jgi:hypothetical protein
MSSEDDQDEQAKAMANPYRQVYPTNVSFERNIEFAFYSISALRHSLNGQFHWSVISTVTIVIKNIIYSCREYTTVHEHCTTNLFRRVILFFMSTCLRISSIWADKSKRCSLKRQFTVMLCSLCYSSTVQL